jgi:hypothetical protein
MPQYKAPPPTSNLPYLLIDNAHGPKPVREIFSHVDDEALTMLLQIRIIGMNIDEIKAYHNHKYSRATIYRKMKQCETALKNIAELNQMFMPPYTY